MKRFLQSISRGLIRFLRGQSNSTAVLKNVGIRVALLGLNFCTGVLVARSLGPAGRGEQAAIALWPPFIATLATFGVPTALNFHSRRNPEQARQLYMGSAITMFVVGLIVSGIGAAAMPLLLHGYDPATIHAAQWFMLFAPETLVASAARAHLESQDQFSRSTLGFFYPALATLVALGILRLSDHLTPMTAALAYIVPPAIQATWIVSRLWERKSFRLDRLPANMKILLPYGLQCYGIDIINALSGQMDLVVIVAFLSPAELGLYTVALSLSRVMNVIQSSVVTILFSRASALVPDDALRLIGRAARLSTAASAGLGIMLFVIAKIAVPIVYGPAFSAALPVLAILIFETILCGAVVVLLQAFMATGRPIFVTIIEGCWTATAVALLFFLVPRMNLTGAATALLFAAVARLALTLLAFPVILKRPAPNLIIDRADIVYLRAKISRFRPAPRTRGLEQPVRNPT